MTTLKTGQRVEIRWNDNVAPEAGRVAPWRKVMGPRDGPISQQHYTPIKDAYGAVVMVPTMLVSAVSAARA